MVSPHWHAWPAALPAVPQLRQARQWRSGTNSYGAGRLCLGQRVSRRRLAHHVRPVSTTWMELRRPPRTTDPISSPN